MSWGSGGANIQPHVLTIYGADGVGGGDGAPTASGSWVDEIGVWWGYISLAVGPNYDITNMVMS